MRRAAATLAARAAATTAAATATANAEAHASAALPALQLLTRQGSGGGGALFGAVGSSKEDRQQQPWRRSRSPADAAAAPSAAATTSCSSSRAFASFSCSHPAHAPATSTAGGGADPADAAAGDRGRPPPNITDAEFTSPREQQEQHARRAAALRASMDALVDGAVEAVERGELGRAVEVLERGLNVLGSEHGEAPELGELHNQAALLLLLQSSGEGDDDGGERGEGEGEEGGGQQQPSSSSSPLSRAAEHASQALRLTERAFGAAHPLTGHRLLRLGTIRLAQGRGSDAAPLLAAAADMLGGGGGGNNNADTNNNNNNTNAFGPGLAEARFHLAVLPLGAARQASAVAAADEPLAALLGELVSLLGPDSMIVRLALAQHSAAVGRGLEHAALLMGGGAGGTSNGSAASLALSEALLRQHVRLQEARDRGSAELGLARYQLAVLYYSHDLLQDAGAALRLAREALAAHVPEGHDVDALLKHRAGMIAAARGEHRAARQLLSASREHYAAQARAMIGGDSSSTTPPTHPLQREADFGLALCDLRELESGASSSKKSKAELEATAAALLDAAGAARRDVARALGASHLLSLGAARHEARARATLQEKLGGDGKK